MILDTGPALNFMASGHHQVLFDVLSLRQTTLQMPQTVGDEIARRSSRDPRFRKCPTVLADLRARELIEVLVDSIDSTELNDAVQVVCGMPLDARIKTSKDLGEVLVMAHALVQRDAGTAPILLIDERPGQDQATDLGLRFTSTVGILVIAAETGIVSKQRTMKRIYSDIHACDTVMGGWTSSHNPLLDNKIYGCKREPST